MFKMEVDRMALSNTATPIYYGQFREQVLAGNLPVCDEISMEMNRIDMLIEDPRFFYDPDPVEGYIEYCENELTLTDGSPLVLLDSFKLWAEEVWGWYYFIERSVYEPSPDNHGGHYKLKRIKKRLTVKQYLIVTRGAAKSMYSSTMQGYGLTVDPETTTGIVCAPTLKQTDEIISPIATAITRSRGPMFKFLTAGSLQNTTGDRSKRMKLASTKKGIQNFLTNSIVEARPMAIEKLQGARPKYSSVDEFLSCDIREDPIGAIEQGASKLDDYLIIATSSEGTIRNGAGDDIKMELLSILRGEYYNPRVSIFYYRLDDIKEINNPEMWIKAQPNIGITVTYDTYQADVERAEKVPSQRNDIIAKRFNIPMEGFTYFFTYEETLKSKPREYWQMPCSLGADLSQGDDFCAFTLLFPLQNGSFGIKTRSYITEFTLMKLPNAMRRKYDEFISEGSLIILPNTVLDLDDVYDDLDRWITQNEYEVLSFGYDPYNAKEFVHRWSIENGEYGVEKVIQGARTESVPLGDLKKLAEAGQLLFDQELMSFAMGNAITMEDTNGNRKLLKKRRSNKIDNVSALMDAYVAYNLHKEIFG